MPGKSGIVVECPRSSRQSRWYEDPDAFDAGRSERWVRNAFAVGASGYVLKDAADTELVEAVRAVARWASNTSIRPWARSS